MNKKSPKNEIFCNSLMIVFISTKIIIMMTKMIVEIPTIILFIFESIIVKGIGYKIRTFNLSDILDQNCKYL